MIYREKLATRTVLPENVPKRLFSFLAFVEVVHSDTDKMISAFKSNQSKKHYRLRKVELEVMEVYTES